MFKDKKLSIDVNWVNNETTALDLFWNLERQNITKKFTSVVQGDIEEETIIPVPFLTEVHHYQLSAAIVKSEKKLGKSSTFTVEPCIFLMDPGNDRFTRHGLKIVRKEISSPENGEVTVDLKGQNYKATLKFTDPALYILNTSPSTVRLDPKTNGLSQETRLYVISKLWCCQRLDISLTLANRRNVKEEVHYSTQKVAGSEGCPHYGVPICFQYSKYPLEEGQLKARVDCDLSEGKKGFWCRRKEFPLFDNIPWPEAECSDFTLMNM